MNPRCLIVLIAAGSAAALASGAGERVDVHPLPRRQATLDAAARLVAKRESTEWGSVRNLFAVPGAVAAAPTPGPSSVSTPALPREKTTTQRLAEIAAQLTPTGSVMIGGQPYLLFGEKRLKEGDSVTIAFDGADHVLTVARIERNQFTLRYHDAEYTRPIRPSSAP